jgi:ribosomal protein S24E
LKAIESLKEKIAKELAIQKEKVSLKQQKQAIGDYHIALLRKINFKK